MRPWLRVGLIGARLAAAALVLSTPGCGALRGVTVTIGTPQTPAPATPSVPPLSPSPATWLVDAVACATASSEPFACQTPIAGATIQMHGPAGYLSKPGDGAGYAVFTLPEGFADSDVIVDAPGYLTARAHIDVAGTHDSPRHNIITLQQDVPLPPTRQYILEAHDSFQGAVLHTTQFGDLNWWPTAWVSLNPTDRAASYAQIASWGDTDITVAISWSYGEADQPYGTIVPNADFTSNLPAFRALVKDVIQHHAANGQPFVPRLFMEGDNGYAYYSWVMPLVLQALQPQPGDPLDLTPYVKLQMCYDSCVPGWQPKTQVGDAILATRAACPRCVIALEFSSGYSSTGDGDGFWNSDAGRALDEVDWEGNRWLPTDWEQYWEILDRWLGPAYRRPAQQVSDPEAPFCATCAKFYLRNGTPRGPYGVQCFEPATFQWVRGQLTFAQAADIFKTLKSLGCPVIAMPQ